MSEADLDALERMLQRKRAAQSQTAAPAPTAPAKTAAPAPTAPAKPAPAKPAKTAAPPASQRAIAVGALTLFVLLWPIGAKYTVLGTIGVINWLLAWIELDYQVQVIGWQTYAILSPLPVIFSQIEWTPPWRLRKKDRSIEAFTTWLIVLLADAGSTYAGLMSSATSNELFAQMMSLQWPIAVAAAVLTLLPEAMGKWGKKALRKG